MASVQHSKAIIAVFGPSKNSLKEIPENKERILTIAENLWTLIARGDCILLTGGVGPEGDTVKARAIGGAIPHAWIGVSSGDHRTTEPKGHVIPTNLGDKRNFLEACLCDAA